MARTIERKVSVVVPDSKLDTKSVEEARAESIQSRAHDDSDIGLGGVGVGGLLTALFRAGELVAPWWSTQRDIDLRRFVKSSDHLSGTVSLLTSKVINVPVHVEPRDLSLKTHMKQADEYMRRLVEESEFGQGWPTLCSKVLDDWFQCDAGLAMEVIGDGPKDGPIVGPALGLASLDVTRCVRKKDREFPLTYLDEDGAQYKLHYTRVAYASDQPSNIVEMRGIGFCSTSRTINIAQQLVDMSLFNMEKLGSRPMRAILFTPGIPTDVVEATMQMSAEMMDNQGLRRYSKIPILGGNSTDADVRLVPLSTLPDGFDQETNTRLAMFAMALGFGVPIRWIWPAATSGATKADAMYQHIAGLGGGIGRILNVLTMILGGDPRGQRHTVGKFLPPHLKLVFDFQDDEQDRMRAEIQKQRMETTATALETGVITLRVAREKALDTGDLTQAQFDAMELADGRLPSGEDVLTLFYTGDQSIRDLLNLGVEDALDVSANDAVTMLSAIEEKQAEVRRLLSETSVASRKKAVKEALAALGKLREAYEEGRSAQQQADDAETEEQARGEDQPGGDEGDGGSERRVDMDEEEEVEETGEGAEVEDDEEVISAARKAWEWIRDRVKGNDDDESTQETTKVWSSLTDVPKHLRTLHGASLTLAQVNHLARMGDALERDANVDEPWAVARAQFQKLYKRESDSWVKREKEEKAVEQHSDDDGDGIIDNTKGGPGSGHHGHSGRPGRRGGSAPSTSSGGYFTRDILETHGYSSRSEIVSELSPDDEEREYWDVIFSVEDAIGGDEVDFGDLDMDDDEVFFEARKYAVNEWQEWGKGLTNDEESALANYANEGYDEINDFLRKGVEPAFSRTEEGLGLAFDVEDTIDGMDQAVGKSKNPSDMVVYRGATDSMIPESGISIGDVIMDKGYTSTSLSRNMVEDTYIDRPGRAGRDFVVKIHVPKGYPAAFLGFLPSEIGKSTKFGVLHELEILLPRGTEFRVVRVERDATRISGISELELEIIW